MAKPQLLFLQILIVWSSAFCVVQGFNVRPATDSDISVARRILLKEAMNPLSLKRENMLVAVDEEDPTEILGFGQIRPLDDRFAELASLFVKAEYRKNGIGGALVKSLLQKHKGTASSKVCLLTLKPTAPFYETFGFQIASADQRRELPSSLQTEFIAGSGISLLLGNELICMIEK